MNTDTIFSEIQKLSTAQKILLLEQAWDDVSQSADEIPIPDWQKKALDERLEEHYANPDENNLSSSELFAHTDRALRDINRFSNILHLIER